MQVATEFVFVKLQTYRVIGGGRVYGGMAGSMAESLYIKFRLLS